MITEAQIDALATHLVSGLIARGTIQPKADEKDLIACVVELMSENLEAEARIDEEADRVATRGKKRLASRRHQIAWNDSTAVSREERL